MYLNSKGISATLWDTVCPYNRPPITPIRFGGWERRLALYTLSSDQDVIISPAGARLPRPQKLITIDKW